MDKDAWDDRCGQMVAELKTFDPVYEYKIFTTDKGLNGHPLLAAEEYINEYAKQRWTLHSLQREQGDMVLVVMQRIVESD